jgi:hypothetical protein
MLASVIVFISNRALSVRHSTLPKRREERPTARSPGFAKSRNSARRSRSEIHATPPDFTARRGIHDCAGCFSELPVTVPALYHRKAKRFTLQERRKNVFVPGSFLMTFMAVERLIRRRSYRPAVSTSFSRRRRQPAGRYISGRITATTDDRGSARCEGFWAAC